MSATIYGGAVRQRLGAILTTVGALVTLVGTFLPWLRSGARGRSSYAIFDLVERLGFAPDGVISWSLRLWPLVPLLLVVLVVVTWWPAGSGRQGTVGVVLAAVATVWAGGTGVAVMVAPEVGLFRIGVGPLVTVVGALVIAVGQVVSRRESGSSAAS